MKGGCIRQHGLRLRLGYLSLPRIYGILYETAFMLVWETGYLYTLAGVNKIECALIASRRAIQDLHMERSRQLFGCKCHFENSQKQRVNIIGNTLCSSASVR